MNSRAVDSPAGWFNSTPVSHFSVLQYVSRTGAYISGEVIGPNRIRVLMLNGKPSTERPEMDIETSAKSGSVTGRVRWKGEGKDKRLVLE